MGQLQQAGVQWINKDFKKFVQEQEKINKNNKKIFDTEFKGTEKSFAQVQQAAKAYERQLEQTRRQQERFRREQERTAAAQRKAAAAQRAQTATQRRQAAGGILSAGGGRLGGGLGGLVGAGLGPIGIATAAVGAAAAIKTASRESAIAAANFNAQEVGINNLAESYGQSGAAIRRAMREASQGTLSETAIIRGANQALLLNVAQTPEQFEEITRTALILGRTMGLDATQAIEQFNTALGRKSLLILDNFGISAKAVNREIERLAQQRFGETAGSLEQVQRDVLFTEAALKIASEAAGTIGPEVIEAVEAFDGLTASSENLKIAFGQLTLPLEAGLARSRTELNETLESFITTIGGFGTIDDDIAEVNRQLERAIAIRDELVFGEGIGAKLARSLGTAEGKTEQAVQKIEELEKLLAELETQALEELGDGAENAANATGGLNEELEETERNVKALNTALQQAERLQLSFARAGEDAARRQGRQVEKLRKAQEKERDKFLADQIKDFDDFNADLLSDIQDAQSKLNDARSKGNDDRLREQAKLHRDLKRAQDRFNLDRVQSERRFQLSDRRLRAEGDILALQELRENRELEKLEGKENFEFSQDQRKEDGKDQLKERDRQRRETVQALERDLADLQNSFGEKQAAFLADQDEEFRLLLAKQQEQRDAQQLAFREQAEDRRINQDRQLEDLGRSLQDQEDLTEEGAAAIAGELEKIFGIDGVADTIFAGFSARTESEFRNLFNTVSGIARNVGSLFGGGASRSSPRGGGRDRPLQFQEGGVVPGPIGAPQAAIVHGGETVLPTSHTMAAPVIPTQRVAVDMSGGFNITGGEQAGEVAVSAALDEMTTSFEIAVRRLIRRG